TYDVAYALIEVTGGAPVTQTNSAFALANCNSCTTVAVSFQVVLVVGQSKDIAPINGAGALNYNCPACTTVAIADQIVVTLSSVPSQALLARLESALRQLNALPTLGAGASPAAIAAQVSSVQDQIEAALNDSGLLAVPLPGTGGSMASATPSGAGNVTGAGSATGSGTTPATTGPGGVQSSPSATTSTTGASTSTGGSTSTSTTSPTSSSTTTSTTPTTPTGSTTTTAPSQDSTAATTGTTTTTAP
ncbi:MAG: hypothetical protein J2P57_08945, partial [Acidimicrobiaceae bacterium]|nr:hypothetical protein [Acidimicrobiaceae bacterium]